MYWHRINGAMKPSAGGCKNRMRFQKYFGLFRFREKLHPCEDAVSLEVCVEIWRICHADRDRKHELYAKISLVRVMEGVLLFLTR